MRTVSYPSISVISVSYNTPLWLWKKTLNALYSQKYPESKIEHIVVDGGSTNGTLEFLKHSRADVIVRRDLLNQPLTRMGIGIRKAKNDLLLFLEPDNIMIGNDWLTEMTRPFVREKYVVGAFSKHNGYERDMPLFTRYCALFGINDPIVLYLRKSEKLPVYESAYSNGETVGIRDGYTVVRFREENLPTLGDNGHMVRRLDITKTFDAPDSFVHTDAFVTLMRQGKHAYAAVNNSIVHFTGSSIMSYFRRRIEYKSRYFDGNRKKRLYLVFNAASPKDRKHLVAYILYSLTFIQPLFLSVRGFLYRPDPAWFLHPVMCFLGVVAYGYSEVRLAVSKTIKGAR